MQTTRSPAGPSRSLRRPAASSGGRIPGGRRRAARAAPLDSADRTPGAGREREGVFRPAEPPTELVPKLLLCVGVERGRVGACGADAGRERCPKVVEGFVRRLDVDRGHRDARQVRLPELSELLGPREPHRVLLHQRPRPSRVKCRGRLPEGAQHRHSAAVVPDAARDDASGARHARHLPQPCIRVAEEVHDELGQRRVEHAVLERHRLRGRDRKPGTRHLRLSRLDERLGRVDSGDVFLAEDHGEGDDERARPAADIERALPGADTGRGAHAACQAWAVPADEPVVDLGWTTEHRLLIAQGQDCPTGYAGDVDALSVFSPGTRAWFERTFDGPTPAQELGWPQIASGAHTLIQAPTGSGKTLAAFLFGLDRLMQEPGEGTRLIYVSPQKERAAMLRHPPDLLITTPESLFLLLTSRARETLTGVRTLILDEVHAVAGTKRGAHLALTVERVERLTGEPFQRIGLSATQRPLEEIGRFVSGGRPIELVDAGRSKELDVKVVVPLEDMREPGVNAEITDILGTGSEAPSQSIWPSIYPKIVELVAEHRSTIVFVNNRRLAERLALRLNELAEKEIARAHHGSLAREQRLEVEELLKRGQIPCLVATSSLELGIDMGAVDLVIQVESPKSVARGLQRVGRAGHDLGEVSKGRVFPKFRADLLESAVVVQRMKEGAIEETQIPRNPLDVLAQQIVAIASQEEISVDDLHALVRRAYPFTDLSRVQLENVLDMLAGRYPSDEFAELRPRIVWDRTAGEIRGRGGARRPGGNNP